jgi:uncharacterized protein DUF6680
MFEWLGKPEGIAAIAAVFSAIATGLAAWTAYKGPQTAAELAERLRSEGDAHADKRRTKLHVFAVLMANRQSYWTGEPVNAFNLIDVVFNDSPDVRSAWAEMYLSFSRGIPDHVRDERLRRLLGAMSRDLNLADELRTDDFGRVYRSDAVVEEQLVDMYRRRSALAAFEGARSPAANTAGPQQGALPNALFPPKPE